MDIPVLLEALPADGYRATSLTPTRVSAEAPSRASLVVICLRSPEATSNTQMSAVSFSTSLLTTAMRLASGENTGWL